MARYIDADSTVKAIRDKFNIYFEIPCDSDDRRVQEIIGKVKNTIQEQPTADVVEVVRCKDCEEWKRNVGFADSPNGHCFCHDIDTNGFDFCSYGERRDLE